MDVVLLEEAAVALSGLVGLGVAAAYVPLPEKFVWALSFLIVAVNGTLHALYQTGGVYTILFPALFWVRSVQQTTGALAFAIASYSFLHRAQISPHWYSLPTGCSPLAIASQYFPSHIIQGTLLAIFIGYCGFLHLAKGGLDAKHLIVVPAVLLIVSSVVSEHGAIALGVATLLYCQQLLKAYRSGGVSIGKKKLF